jgi:hypothetical protein
MFSSIKFFRSLNQYTGCIKAIDMPIDQYTRSLSRGMIHLGAYRYAVLEYCESFFDAHGVEDCVKRHEVCSSLRNEMALPTLFAIWVDSPQFKEAYLGKVGYPAPLLRDPSCDPVSTFFYRVVQELWVNTSKEEKFGIPENAHNQKIKKIAKAAKEVGLVKYSFSHPKRVLYEALPPLHQFFTEDLPMKMDDL